MTEPQDRDEAMDMLEEKRRGLRADYRRLERDNERLRELVRGLRDPTCPEVQGERVTWAEYRRVSRDGP
jgi:hypothetical protein